MKSCSRFFLLFVNSLSSQLLSALWKSWRSNPFNSSECEHELNNLLTLKLKKWVYSSDPHINYRLSATVIDSCLHFSQTVPHKGVAPPFSSSECRVNYCNVCDGKDLVLVSILFGQHPSVSCSTVTSFTVLKPPGIKSHKRVNCLPPLFC